MLLLFLLIKQLANTLEQPNGLCISSIGPTVTLYDNWWIIEILRLVLIPDLILNRLHFHVFLSLILILLFWLLWTLLILLVVMGRWNLLIWWLLALLLLLLDLSLIDQLLGPLGLVLLLLLLQQLLLLVLHLHRRVICRYHWNLEFHLLLLLLLRLW